MIAAGCTIFLLLAGCTVLEQINPFAVTATPIGRPPLQDTSSPLAPSPAPTMTSQTSAHHLILWVPPNFDPHSGTAAGNLLQVRLDEFINAHPGLTVDVRIKAASGPGGLLDSLSTTNSAAPGAIPSMVVLPRSDMETAALKGLIFPWTDLIKFNPAADSYAYAAALGKVQGATYGLPIAGDALVMVYRPLQVAYAPTSWNEYTTRKYPVIFPAADPEALLTTQMLLSLQQTDQQLPETPGVDQTALKKAYIVINDGARSGTFPYWLADYDTFDKGYKAFLDNQANYAVVWASSVLNRLPENVSLASLPAVSANPFTLADGWMWVLTNPSEDQRQITVALAEYLLDEKFLAAWTEASHLLPTSQSILKQWQNQADAATINEVASSARLIPSNQYTSSISPILQQGTLGMVRGQINYLQAFENSLKGLELVSPTPGG
jgi:maltose-binding protein MalE